MKDFPAQPRAGARRIDGAMAYTKDTNESGPAGASTPVTPGLADYEGVDL